MAVQLKALALRVGDDVVASVEGKTRQTYNEKPLTVKVEGGQKVTEGYEYSVAFSGIIASADKKMLAGWAEGGAKVEVFGYTDTGLVIKGHGMSGDDKGVFTVKAKGVDAMRVSDGIAVTQEKMWMPFDGLTLRLEVTARSLMSVSVEMDDAMQVLWYDCPRWQGKMTSSQAFTTQECSYILLHSDHDLSNAKLTIEL